MTNLGLGLGNIQRQAGRDRAASQGDRGELPKIWEVSARQNGWKVKICEIREVRVAVLSLRFQNSNNFGASRPPLRFRKDKLLGVHLLLKKIEKKNGRGDGAPVSGQRTSLLVATALTIRKCNNFDKSICRYLGWTSKYKKIDYSIENAMCEICKMATEKEQHSIPNIYDWWENESDCYNKYAENLLNMYS